jgi:hypothetical protein
MVAKKFGHVSTFLQTLIVLRGTREERKDLAGQEKKIGRNGR